MCSVFHLRMYFTFSWWIKIFIVRKLTDCGHKFNEVASNISTQNISCLTECRTSVLAFTFTSKTKQSRLYCARILHCSLFVSCWLLDYTDRHEDFPYRQQRRYHPHRSSTVRPLCPPHRERTVARGASRLCDLWLYEASPLVSYEQLHWMPSRRGSSSSASPSCKLPSVSRRT